MRANNTAVAVNQRTSDSSLLLERVAEVDAQSEEDLFHGTNFIDGLGPETKILDIPFDKLGTLCGVAPTISFIPDNRAMFKQADTTNLHTSHGQD